LHRPSILFNCKESDDRKRRGKKIKGKKGKRRKKRKPRKSSQNFPFRALKRGKEKGLKKKGKRKGGKEKFPGCPAPCPFNRGGRVGKGEETSK